MESVYDPGEKKSAQTCNVLWSFNQIILKFGCFSSAWLVLSSFGFDCKQNQSNSL